MARKKKRFIDKKTAVHFDVVPRPYSESGRGDEASSQFMLQPSVTRGNKANKAKTEALHRDLDGFVIKDDPKTDSKPFDPFTYNPFANEPAHSSSTHSPQLAHDYDYSQHLRQIGNNFVSYEGNTKTQKEIDEIRSQYSEIDPDLKESDILQAESNQNFTAAPFNDNVKDFLTALDGASDDDTGDFEELLDDFVQLAMQDVDEEKGGEGDRSEQSEMSERSGERSERKTGEAADEDALEKRFNQLSLDFADSGGEHSDDGLELDAPITESQANLEEHFSVFMKNEYEMEEEDSGEEFEVEGEHDISAFRGVIDDHLEQKRISAKKLNPLQEAINYTHKAVDEFARLDALAEGKEIDAEAQIESMFAKPKAPEWDCETVISTYSTTENIPHMIPRLNQRKPKPEPIVLSKHGVPMRTIQSLEDESSSDDGEPLPNLGVKRGKNETKEEKKARKSALKIQRKQSRIVKKMLKTAFKDEELKQMRVQAGRVISLAV